MAQPHPTPQKHHSPNAQSQCDCAENCRSHKTLRLRSELILHTSTSYVSTRFLATSHESDTSRFQAKLTPKPSPNGSGLSVLLRTAADGCGRLQTVADGYGRLRTVAKAETTSREQGSTPRPPDLNENPSARTREEHSHPSSPSQSHAETIHARTR